MSYELDALAKWVASKERKPADLAFTAGPARQIADRFRLMELQVGEMKKALASLPCKYEDTYGIPTPEHSVFPICPPCWARKGLGHIKKLVEPQQNEPKMECAPCKRGDHGNCTQDCCCWDAR